MGRLQIDIHKGSREWGNIAFSDIQTVRGLIKFRARFDLLLDREQCNIMDSSTDLSGYEEEIICTYVDLDYIISKTRLSKNQKKVLALYMRDYDEKDISDVLGIKEVTVNSMINTICEKIVDRNYEEWKSWVHWDKKRVTGDYKKCTKCNEYLPATEEYFSPHEKGQYNLHPYCKKCR